MTNRDNGAVNLGNSVTKIDIRGYDIKTVEDSLSKIIIQVTKMSLRFSGPIYLPVKREFITVLRSPHKHKDSREQFERRIHKRSLYIFGAEKSHSRYFSELQIPYSVKINIKSMIRKSKT